MPLLTLDVHGQVTRRAPLCSDGSSDVVLLSRIPLYVSLQQCIEHLEPQLVDSVAQVRVVTVAEEPKCFGLLLKCRSSTDALRLVSDLDDSLGPSAFNEVRLAAVQVHSDALPTKLHGLGARPARSGNSPLLHATDGCVSMCSICLDATDGFTGSGTITTICSHTFHLQCIARCSHGEPCPLCRFDMLLLDGSSECTACGGTNDLWMCLVCGAVNCGRNKQGHAHDHFRLTAHSHVCQVGGSRVWDYEADAFVHHLAIPEDGGAPRPVPTTDRWCDDDEELLDEVLLQSKIEVVNDYYSRILNSQLRQQQQYFESIMSTRNVQCIARLENIGRHAIARQSACAIAVLLGNFSAALKAIALGYQKRAQKTTHQVDFLTTTLRSIREGNAKLQSRIDSFRPTSSSQSTRISELEAVMQKLILELDA